MLCVVLLNGFHFVLGCSQRLSKMVMQKPWHFISSHGILLIFPLNFDRFVISLSALIKNKY